MIEIDSTDRSFVRSSLSLSLAPRDGPLARASTLDAFDDTVRPRASAASADDGARESDVDGLRNCAQLGPERRQSASHDSRRRDSVLAPYPEKIFFNAPARARLRLLSVVCLSISPLRARRECAALRVLFVARVGRSNDVHGERDGGRVARGDGVAARRRRRRGRRSEFASNARAHAERSKTASDDAGVKGEVGANARIVVDGGGGGGGGRRRGGVARESPTRRPARPSPARAAHDPSHRPERIVVKHERALIVRLERVGSFPVRLRPKLFTRAHDGALFVRERIHPARRALGAPFTYSLTRARERFARRGHGGVVADVRADVDIIRARARLDVIPLASRPRPFEGVVHHLHAQIIERARRYLSSRHRRSRASRLARRRVTTPMTVTNDE